MKGYRKVLLLYLLFSSLSGFAQDRGKALSFEETYFNFGEIEESRGPVSHSFVFYNRTGKDVFLTSVIPSCSCTTVKYNHAVIAPDAVGEITVTYDPASLPGQFRQNVLVNASDRSSRRIIIEGNVRERDKGLDERYPYFVADGLQVSNLNVRFGFMPQGTYCEKRIGIVNTSSSPLNLGFRTEREDRNLTVSLPANLASGEESEMVIAFNIPEGCIGTADNSVFLSASGSEAVKPVRIQALAVYSLDKSGNQASLRFEPTLLDFSGRRKKAEVSLTNDGRQGLKIFKVECPEGVEFNIPDGTVIPGGQSIRVQVRLLSTDVSGQGSIRLFSNDTARPMREIIYKTTR